MRGLRGIPGKTEGFEYKARPCYSLITLSLAWRERVGQEGGSRLDTGELIRAWEAVLEHRHRALSGPIKKRPIYRLDVSRKGTASVLMHRKKRNQKAFPKKMGPW